MLFRSRPMRRGNHDSPLRGISKNQFASFRGFNPRKLAISKTLNPPKSTLAQGPQALNDGPPMTRSRHTKARRQSACIRPCQTLESNPRNICCALEPLYPIRYNNSCARYNADLPQKAMRAIAALNAPGVAKAGRKLRCTLRSHACADFTRFARQSHNPGICLGNGEGYSHQHR